MTTVDGNKTAECEVTVTESTADTFEIEDGKGLEYEEGKITFRVSGVSDAKNITAYVLTYDSEEEAQKRAENAAVDGSVGYALTNDGSGTWTYTPV